MNIYNKKIPSDAFWIKTRDFIVDIYIEYETI